MSTWLAAFRLVAEQDRPGPQGVPGATGALAPAPVFANTTAGLAGTSSGQYFTVPSTSPGETFILYLNSTGTASEVRRFQSVLNVYADSAAGSDANDGLTPITAWRTRSRRAPPDRAAPSPGLHPV